MTRKALCVGINDYPGTQNDLHGCVNDANDWADALVKRGFHATYLQDKRATGKAIVDAIGALISQALAGDVVVITYSGHGTWVPDQNGDELDHHDEALCPHDIMSAGPLIDDTLVNLFSQVQPGVLLTFVADSCFSGTIAKFGDFGTPRASRADRVRFLPPEHFLPPQGMSAARASLFSQRRSLAKSHAITLSACQDTEYSYDAAFNGRPNGAFTRVALDALEATPTSLTYAGWMTAIRRRLPSAQYPQRPGLTATAAQKKRAVLT